MITQFSLAFGSTLVLLIVLLKTRLANVALDHPNHRSLHTAVIPRTGGLAIMTGVLISWSVIVQEWTWLLLVLVLMIVSVIDDVRGLSIKWRFLTQLLVCIAFMQIGAFTLEWWEQALVALALVWMINLYNFMDGADGLAGGMALFGFGFYSLAAYLAGDMNFALVAGCISVAALAFLLFNFPPARIFMGDAGSIPLGFLAGSMGFHGWQNSLWPIWFPILVFSPFIVDATVTIIKRLFSGEKIWQAHKSHYYQRLIQMCGTHRVTTIREYGLMLAVGLSATFLLKQTSTVALMILALWVLFYGVVMMTIDRRWRLKQGSVITF
jgi:UDP-GlcNAc:undecaprenyl-phosphate/decaprenyl-phosphate GlcNAc-1-phosphate transferase